MPSGDDADGRVRRDGRVERRADRDVERDLPERVDVADLARVEVGAGLDRELAHLAPDLAGHEDDVRREAVDLGVARRHVLAEDLVDVADRDAGGDRILDGRHEPGPEDRLDEDAVVLARRDRILELLASGRPDRCWRRTPSIVGTAGRGCLLGGCEHGRVVAVGDREREVRDLQWLLVLREHGWCRPRERGERDGRGGHREPATP